MSVRDDLIAAKALIDTPEKWWKGEAYSYAVGSECAVTACQAVANNMTGERVFAMTRTLDASLPESRTWPRSVIDFNDLPTTTHADIIALFDRAIAAAEPTP